MKKGVLIVILLVLATMIFASSAYAKAQYYPVTVSKVQSNLYLDKNRTSIFKPGIVICQPITSQPY